MDTIPQNKHLFSDICQIIETARGRVALTANAELTLMYWHIGNRINTDVLQNQRAEYGKQIVSTLANQLQEKYGAKSFDEKKHQKNDAIRNVVSRYSNCRTTGTTIVMVSFSESYAFKRRAST